MKKKKKIIGEIKERKMGGQKSKGMSERSKREGKTI